MAKQLFQVVELVVVGSGNPIRKPIKSNLTAGKAEQLRDKLEEKNSKEDFNPDKVSSFLVQPA